MDITLTVEMGAKARRTLERLEYLAETGNGPQQPLWRAGQLFARKLSFILQRDVHLVCWSYTATKDGDGSFIIPPAYERKKP